ncbi:MAG: pentapeptide repeat-containing protein [Verrucomicrobiales bacterium]|nr:pentapeptide repeat-containing protein [Verrucomicrobiales bacterium]
MRTVIQNQSLSVRRNGWDADSALVLDATFTDCELQGAILTDAVLVRCRFDSVSFYWAQMYRTLFIECTFADVDFRGANMDECMFVRCQLDRCNFSRDNLGGDTDMSGVTFTDCGVTP